MLEASGRFLGVSYVNDGMFGSRDSDWLQHSMNVFIGLFQRYCLTDNFVKSFTMTFLPGALRLGISDDFKEINYTGLGASYRRRLQ